ncbi:MAG TPA: hypothetical protein VEZ89_04515, partial [Rubrivivax sp.]|nr:hypothetical protein [Rubrivivax sp.]
QELFDTHLHPGNAIALRTATERGKLVIALPAARELPWLTPSPVPAHAKRITDAQQSLLPSGAQEAVSDNGELRRHWGAGLFVVDTPRSQLASGWIGGRTIDTSGASVAVQTPNATVAVQSMDDKPLKESSDIFVSWAARAVTTSANRLPFLSEPLAGTVTLTARPGLKVYSLGPKGEARPVAFEYKDGRYLLDLGAVAASTHWLRIR